MGCVVNVGTSYDCVSSSAYSCDYWAGAKKKCESLGMTLPDFGTLKNIAAQKASIPNLPQSGWFWSSSDYTLLTAWGINFSNGNNGYYIKGTQGGVFCVGN